MELDLLKALVLIFGVSAVSILVLHRLKAPPMVGFIAAGVLIGPNGLGLIRDTHEVEILAEIGVILLLFTVGIEFSLRGLLRMRKAVLLGGGFQVLLSIAAGALLAYPFARSANTSLFFGFLLALSSTAIVLKILFERGEIDSPHGRHMTGILIFQDLCVVPLMLVVPMLAGGGTDASALALAIFKAAAIVVLVLVFARWLVPGILHQVVHTRSKELFVITVILICLGIALFTSRVGLSLALGAFLAGLVLSESEYAYQAMSDVLPLKEGFMGIFFVSIGMLVETDFIAAKGFLVAGAVGAILLIKFAASAVSLLLISVPPRVALHAGLGLSQIGEFSFILAAVGRQNGIFQMEQYQLFLASAIITMALTPFLLRWSPWVSAWLSSRPKLKRLTSMREETQGAPRLSGHVIIVGFGLNGRNLANTLRASGIPYVVLELNSNTVRVERIKGQPIFYGDGTSVHLLDRLGIKTARVLVVAISDPSSTRKTVLVARKENPSIHIIVRTRYIVEVDDLAALGADEVIPEEFETSIEIFSRVLSNFNVPRNVINDHIENIRKDAYIALRSQAVRRRTVSERADLLGEVETELHLVKKGSSADGRSLRDLELRARTGATVMAYQRGGRVFHNPSADYVIREKDILLLIGTTEEINRAVERLDSKKPGEKDAV